MKTYKDIYKFPLHKLNHCSHVVDSAGNFVFQFEPIFDNKGDYADGWQNLEKKLLNTINSKDSFSEATFYHKDGEIFRHGNDAPLITIRGWGNLTGIGGHHLPEEEAANIQDTFAEYIVERLNFRK